MCHSHLYNDIPAGKMYYRTPLMFADNLFSHVWSCLIQVLSIIIIRTILNYSQITD